MEIDVGRVVARKYELVRLVGMGAMGQVWTARHATLLSQVAIKLMSADSIDSHAEALRRFQIEAQIAAALSRKSRHIVSVSDHGEEDDVAYLVMELLDGMTLYEHLESRGPLPTSMVADIVRQVTKGLAVAHAEGVIHRDLKPGNLFVGRDEEGRTLVKILDFGIARLSRRIGAAPGKQTARPTKLTMRGVILGSTLYMSPEQAMGDELDTRTDVWSLGVVAFETLTGVTPFEEEEADAVLRRICNFKATSLRSIMPSASEALEHVFRRAFTRRIEERFQTADDFSQALSAACGTVALSPIVARRVPALELALTAAEPVVLPKSSNTALIIAVCAAVTVASAVAVALMLRAPTRPIPAAPTQVRVEPAVPLSVTPPTVAAPQPSVVETTIPSVKATPQTKPSTPVRAPSATATATIDKGAIF